MIKYKLFYDNDTFGIEHKATASLTEIKVAHGIPCYIRCRLIETFNGLTGLHKTYRLDGTGYSFTIIEVN